MAKSAVSIRRTGGAILKANGAGALVAPATGDCCGCGCPSNVCDLCAGSKFPQNWGLTLDGLLYALADGVCIPVPGGSRLFSDGGTYASLKFDFSTLGHTFADPNGTYVIDGSGPAIAACGTLTDTAGPNSIGLLLNNTTDCSFGGTLFTETTFVRARLERVAGFWVSSVFILLGPLPAGEDRFHCLFYDRVAAADGDSCMMPLAFTNQLTGTCVVRTIDGMEFADLGSGGTMVWTPCVTT